MLGGPAGIQNLRDIPSVMGHFRQRPGPCTVAGKQGSHGVDPFTQCNVSLGNHVEQQTEIAFPGRKQFGHLGDDHHTDTGIRQHLFDITEIGVRTDNGFGAAVVGDIFKIPGRVDRCYGDAHAPGALDAQPGNHPLNAVGHVDHHALARSQTVVQESGGKPFCHRF